MSPPARALSTAAFATLLLIAALMGANHVAARLAFNHGVDVPTAVSLRSGATALVVGALLLIQRVPLALTARQRKALPLIGVLIAIQSLCLYSAVARLPVALALALLVFNSFPLMTALWARLLYRHRPERALLVAMPVILLGLVLALDVLGAASGLGAAGQWREIGAGVGYALANAALGGNAPLLYQAALRTDQVAAFVAYATAVIAVSLVVYVFFLKNRGANWLDDESAMHAGHNP